MKKYWIAGAVAAILVLSLGIACAQPEPDLRTEISRKPGVDFRQFKSVGNEIAIVLRPTADWAIDKSEPFLQSRIRDLTFKSARMNGWVPVNNEDADLKLTVKIWEWGRIKDSKDPNLMEFLHFELSAVSPRHEGLVFRAKGKYSRIDPVQGDLARIPEVFRSLMDDFLYALRYNEDR